MIIEDIGDTNPDAGVIATSPATAPEAAPTVDGLPVCAQDIRAQVTAAIPVAICVATNALVAFVRRCTCGTCVETEPACPQKSCT